MEFSELMRVIWRWLWLIILVVVVTGVVLLYVLWSAPSVYEATTTVKLSTAGQLGWTDLDATAAFLEVLQSDEVKEKTSEQLGLGGGTAAYDVEVRSLGNAGFVDIVVQAPSPDVAAEIVNTHLNLAIESFVELTTAPLEELQSLLAEDLSTAQEELSAAQTAMAELRAESGIGDLDQKTQLYEQRVARLQQERDDYVQNEPWDAAGALRDTEALIAEYEQELDWLSELLPEYHLLQEQSRAAIDNYREAADEAGRNPDAALAQQLSAAEAEMIAADQAFADFLVQNGFASLEEEMGTVHEQLQRLKVQRDQILMNQSANAIDPASDPVAEIDKLLAEIQAEWEQLMALTPEYYVLVQRINQANTSLSQLQRQYDDAQVRAAAIKTTDVVQIVEPTQATRQSAADWQRLLVLGVAASLGLGIVLALSLEYVFPSKKKVAVASPDLEQQRPTPQQPVAPRGYEETVGPGPKQQTPPPEEPTTPRRPQEPGDYARVTW